MNSLEVLGAVIIPESEQEKIAELICSKEDPDHVIKSVLR